MSDFTELTGSTGEKAAGYTLMVGATGSGKTCVLNAVLAGLRTTTGAMLNGNRASRRGRKNVVGTSRGKWVGKRASGARP